MKVSHAANNGSHLLLVIFLYGCFRQLISDDIWSRVIHFKKRNRQRICWDVHFQFTSVSCVQIQINSIDLKACSQVDNSLTNGKIPSKYPLYQVCIFIWSQHSLYPVLVVSLCNKSQITKLKKVNMFTYSIN